MDLSENDVIMIGTAPVGDLVILDNGVVKIVGRDDVGISLVEMGCQAFHHCDNMATTIIDHSVLGLVPACQRCEGILS